MELWLNRTWKGFLGKLPFQSVLVWCKNKENQPDEVGFQEKKIKLLLQIYAGDIFFNFTSFCRSGEFVLYGLVLLQSFAIVF
jgi:hypothetical protein